MPKLRSRSLFTLHSSGDLGEVRGSYIARSPEEVAQHTGGEFIPRSGGRCASSTNPLELGVCGAIRFAHDLFHEPNETEDALGAWGRRCFNIPGGGGLLMKSPQGYEEMIVREAGITQLVQKTS